MGGSANEHQGGVEGSGDDDCDAVVDVDRAEVKTGLAAERRPASGAGVVHPKPSAKQRAFPACRTAQPGGAGDHGEAFTSSATAVVMRVWRVHATIVMKSERRSAEAIP